MYRRIYKLICSMDYYYNNYNISEENKAHRVLLIYSIITKNCVNLFRYQTVFKCKTQRLAFGFRFYNS